MSFQGTDRDWIVKPSEESIYTFNKKSEKSEERKSEIWEKSPEVLVKERMREVTKDEMTLNLDKLKGEGHLIVNSWRRNAGVVHFNSAREKYDESLLNEIDCETPLT